MRVRLPLFVIDVLFLITDLLKFELGKEFSFICFFFLGIEESVFPPLFSGVYL